MSTVQIPNVDKPTQQVVMVDPTTGAAIGTSTAPLVTQTSSLQTTADLTSSLVTITTATTTTLVAAAASTRARIYRMEVDCNGTNVLTFNAGTNRVQTYGAGGGHIINDFATRPWFTTAVNTAFTVTTTGTATVNVVVEWTRVA